VDRYALETVPALDGERGDHGGRDVLPGLPRRPSDPGRGTDSPGPRRLPADGPQSRTARPLWASRGCTVMGPDTPGKHPVEQWRGTMPPHAFRVLLVTGVGVGCVAIASAQDRTFEHTMEPQTGSRLALPPVTPPPPRRGRHHRSAPRAGQTRTVAPEGRKECGVTRPEKPCTAIPGRPRPRPMSRGRVRPRPRRPRHRVAAGGSAV